MTASRRYGSYRAPPADRQILCDPPWSALPRCLADNRQALAACPVEILGLPLADFAGDARRELIRQTEHYSRSYADVSLGVDANLPIVITGHQPGFMHPGVWLKNFAAARLAQAVGGTAINLVIDNDLCRVPSIRVPTGTVAQPQVVDIPFDQPQQEMPYEERAIKNRPLWASFGKRATQALAPLVPNPILADWWHEVVTLSEQTQQPGLAIAQARHKLELQWGSPSLEVPQSQVCQTASFHRFALHLLVAASRLRKNYNESLAEYRQVHHLRNAAQPLPDLAEVADWIETPFWIWTKAEPSRRALYAKPTSHGIQLTDRHRWQAILPLTGGGDHQAALQRLADWQQQGVKLRTRALITTLYARLVLADLFVHGIGGARYDQVTDALSSRFFGVLPPAFATMSGTLRLPIGHPGVSPSRPSELRQTLRELSYHPESHLSGRPLDPADQSQVDAWIDQKTRWVRTAKTTANAAERHAQIVAANQALQPWLEPQRKKVEYELATTLSQTRTNQLLESREYPFCLFPFDPLRKFLLDFSDHIP